MELYHEKTKDFFRYLRYFLGSVFVLFYLTMTPEAATISNIEFRGGGCIMNQVPGQCTNASWQIDQSTSSQISVNMTFSKVEGEDEGGEGGKKGACNGAGGPPASAGHDSDGSHGDHVEIFARLAPIHMFLTLENSGNGYNDITFRESIVNTTGIDWDGFLFALKHNEEGNAMFQYGEAVDPTSNLFDKRNGRGKKLEWSDGSLGEENGLFEFTVRFKDIPPDSTDHMHTSETSYTIMLQGFP